MGEEDGGHQRIVLLNRLISHSVSRAPDVYKPPLHGAEELLKIIETRRVKGWAVEFPDALDDDDEAKRIIQGAGFNFLRLRSLRFDDAPSARYATMLFEYVDQSVQSFPVVHTKKFTGREIAGDDDERGATAAHVVVRLPTGDEFDDGSYRCAVEAVSPITRPSIERFLSRQIRRYSEAQDWTFSVEIIESGKKPKARMYKYHPKLHLAADFGRKITGADGKTLSHMIFTKRSERHSIGKESDIKHEDILADVEIKVSAKQAPNEPEKRKTFLDHVRAHYENLGFDTRLYYRHAAGRMMSGEVHDAVAGATDLLMCQREIISSKKPFKRWVSRIDPETTSQMKTMLTREELWQRAT